MTAATRPFTMPWLRWRTGPVAATARTDPPVQRPRAPVLIQDAVTPFAGHTLLLWRLRAELDAAADREGD